MSNDIFDLSNRINRHTCIDEPLRDKRLFGGVGIIPAIFGSLECARFSDERAGDHATHLERIAQASGNFTTFIQFVERDDIVVGSQLNDRVRTGVGNPRAGFHMFFAQLINNCNSAGGFVSNNRAPGFFFKGLGEFRRE